MMLPLGHPTKQSQRPIRVKGYPSTSSKQHASVLKRIRYTGSAIKDLDARARVGTAKVVLAGPTSQGDGSYRLTYGLRIENMGQLPLRDIRASDDLGVTFAAAQGFVVDAVRSSELTVNPAYDGRTDIELLAGSDSLVVGDAGTIEVDVTVRPGTSMGPYDNTAVGRGMNASGVEISDASTNGLDADPNGNGDPGDDQVATRLSFAETPRVGLAKAVQRQPEKNADGTWGVTYRFGVHNKESFQTLCEDFRQCSEALKYWNRSTSEVAPVRREEYRALLRDLAGEILQSVGESKRINGENTNH